MAATQGSETRRRLSAAAHGGPFLPEQRRDAALSIWTQRNQENHLARGVLEGLEKDDVLLANRGFCSFGPIGVMLARAVDCVMRLHQARPRDFRQGKRLSKKDRLVSWRKSPSRKNDP